MSSDKKSGSHSHKQRKKSPASLVIHHESPEIASTSINGTSVSQLSHPQEPVKMSSSSKDGILNAGITPPMRQRLSSGSLDGEPHSGSSGWTATRKVSRTQSESGAHTKTVAFALPENDEVFCDTSSLVDLAYQGLGEMASLHRPVSIEEELYAKVNQLNSLVLLWRKRWKQQKECSDGLVQQIQCSKQECATMIEKIKEMYTQKVQGLHNDLNKEIKERQKQEKEKMEISQRLSKTIEEKDSERRSWKDMLRIKDEEVIVGLSKQEEARTTIRIIKKELSKVKRENEKLVRHIAKLRSHISELEERNGCSTPSEKVNCSGECEHKILFELAMERVRFYDDLLSHQKPKCDRSRYVLRTDPEDPLNMSIESAQDPQSSDDVFDDSRTKCSFISSSSSQEGKSPLLTTLFDDRGLESVPDYKPSNINKNSCTETKMDLQQFGDKPADIAHGHNPRSSSSSPKPTGIDFSPEPKDIESCQECLDTSTNSDSALSGEGDLLHLPLRKCVTLDVSPPKKTSLARSKTWLGSRGDSPSPDSGSGSLSPNGHDYDLHLNGLHHSSATSSPRLVRSGFEGLRERRNGITDTRLDASLQLRLSKPRKSHEFSDILKKFSFHTGPADTGVKDRENTTLPHHSSHKKAGFMTLGVSMLTRKKSNSLKDM